MLLVFFFQKELVLFNNIVVKVISLSPEIFRLLYKIAKIAFITRRTSTSLDYIYAVQDMIPFIYHFVC